MTGEISSSATAILIGSVSGRTGISASSVTGTYGHGIIVSGAVTATNGNGVDVGNI